MDTLISLIIDALCTSRFFFFFLGGGGGGGCHSFFWRSSWLTLELLFFKSFTLFTNERNFVENKMEKKLADFRF